MAEHIMVLRSLAKTPLIQSKRMLGRVLLTDDASTQSQLTHLQAVVREKDREINEQMA